MKYRYLNKTGALHDTLVRAPSDDAKSPLDHAALLRPLITGRIPAHIAELVPAHVAWEHMVMPVAFDGETITLAARSSEDLSLADKLQFVLAKGIRLVRAEESALKKAIARHYGRYDPREWAESLMASQAQPERASVTTMDDALALESSPSATVERRAYGGLSHRGSRSQKERRAHFGPSPVPTSPGLDNTPTLGGQGMFFYTVEEGQRVLVRSPSGKMAAIAGPKMIWRGWKSFTPMKHFVAHPGEFLIVRFRDGRQQHLPGPTELWMDPREHLEVTKEEALQIDAKEAVVVYSKSEETGKIARRIVYGPELFAPEPGEWLHTFSWHASKGGSKGVNKVANALVFQKLWLMPDQMYHDVHDVRTADDAVLTIRLMIFFELLDIEKMLDTTHDPIGDFVNAATSDAVEFTGRFDFESFKQNTDRLNELEAYKQLSNRAAQSGYRINKVVYRGYGAADALQQMHDQAIEARTRLQLDRATETQAQELENFRLESQLARAAKRRTEQTAEVEHDLEIAKKRGKAEIERREAQQAALRQEEELAAQIHDEIERKENARNLEHLTALQHLSVDLTAYLTQSRADRLIEIRGGAGTQLHLDSNVTQDRAPKEDQVGPD